MENKCVEFVFVLDRSGSMSSLRSDTIGGFNAMIAEQKEKEGNCLVSTVLFNESSTVVHDRVPLAEVPCMTNNDYFPSGGTALVDALADAIERIKLVHRYIRPEDVPSRTVFTVITDGQENSSVRYHSDQLKKMIEERKEAGWEFLFVGANIDAVETASNYGIAQNRSVNYHADSQGTGTVFKAVSCVFDCLAADRPIEENWDQAIQEDYKKRKKHRK